MAYHSIRFTDINGGNPKHTWNDWHLIPATPPVVTQPNPVYKYVDIPGRDGSIDLSEYLIGRPSYSDRSGSFTFYVANEDPETGKKFPENMMERKAEIAQYLNGKKRMRMYLTDDDSNYFYKGRFYMKSWTPGENFSQVTIEYRVDPYKYDNVNGGAVIG